MIELEGSGQGGGHGGGYGLSGSCSNTDNMY